MLKGVKAGMEAIEKAKNNFNNKEVFIPNIDTGSDRMSFRILADVGEIEVHPIYVLTAQEKNDTDALEYVRRTRRYWDFCIAGHDVKCPHCMDRLKYEKEDRYKKLQRKFVVPVLVKPHTVNIPAKRGNPAKNIEVETKVAYLLLSSNDMATILQLLDIPDIRNQFGDSPNDYLTNCDLEIFKSGTGFNTTKVQIPFSRNMNPITPEEEKLVCEFFNIESYSPEAVQDAMLEEWNKDELEAVERLTKSKKADNNDEGDVPPGLNFDGDDDVKL